MTFKTLSSLVVLAALSAFPIVARAQMAWSGYAGDAQHTAVSGVAAQSLDKIIWQTPVDLAPQYSGNDLLIHYGTPLMTPANTVLVPVKTGATDGFKVDARDGANGALKWSFSSDYILPPHDWTPSYSPAITPGGRIYMPGAGGTVYYRDSVDSSSPGPVNQIAFYGNGNYNGDRGAFNGSVFINTPITSDSAGNVYFGFQVNGANPLGLQGGIARIGANGVATYVSAAAASGDGGMTKTVQNAAPALSLDSKTVYAAVNGGSGPGYLLALDSATLAQKSRALLTDPASGAAALLHDDGTASPTVGPDGHVFFGVLEDPFNSSKGWLLQFTGDLSASGIPGAFGWDDTASVVRSNLVPSYHGASPYLLFTKYNNYAGLGGDGHNRIAVLDPTDTMIDPRTGAIVMKEVLTILGQTPDDDFPNTPGAVREWCINTAVVDPFTDSVYANSEDGKLYQWDLATNTFARQITLTPGIGEAYTPTFIGADGKVYAVNNATLFAVGGIAAVPEPGLVVAALALVSAIALGWRRRAQPPGPSLVGEVEGPREVDLV